MGTNIDLVEELNRVAGKRIPAGRLTITPLSFRTGRAEITDISVDISLEKFVSAVRDSYEQAGGHMVDEGTLAGMPYFAYAKEPTCLDPRFIELLMIDPQRRDDQKDTYDIIATVRPMSNQF